MTGKFKHTETAVQKRRNKSFNALKQEFQHI